MQRACFRAHLAQERILTDFDGLASRDAVLDVRTLSLLPSQFLSRRVVLDYQELDL